MMINIFEICFMYSTQFHQKFFVASFERLSQSNCKVKSVHHIIHMYYLIFLTKQQANVFGSDRSPRRGNLVCACGTILKRTLKMSSRELKQASKQASRQSGKQASRQTSRHAGKQVGR